MQNSKNSHLNKVLALYKCDRATRINFRFIYFFLGLLSIGIWSLWFGIRNDEIKAAKENFASVPTITTIQDLTFFHKNMDTFVTTFFPVRMEFIRILNWTKINLLKQKFFSQVIVGKDGWLYFTSEQNIDDFQKSNLFAQQQIAQIQKTVDDWGKFFSEQGIPVIILIAPNKETIYPEYIPDVVRSLDSSSRFDQIIEQISFPENIHILDPRAQLIRAKQSNSVYFKTDTHWNLDGGCIAYTMLMNEIQNELSLANHLNCEQIQKSKTIFSGDLSKLLYMQGAITEESIVGDFSFSRSTLTQIDGNKWMTSTISDSSLPQIMIFRDSFFTELIPLVSENFREVDYFWTFQIDFERISKEHPALVIIEFAERYIQTALIDNQ